MKSTSLLSFFLLLIVLNPFNTFAQAKPFEGVINYEITFPESNLPPETQGMLPKNMKLLISGDFSKTEMIMSMGNQSVLIDHKNLKTTALINVMGQKYAIIQTKQEIDAETGGNQIPSVVVTDETKEIAGYTCKKAIITIKNKEGKETDKFTVFFTEDIKVKDMYFHQPSFKDITGGMLEFEMEAQEGLRMKLSALSVEKKKISKEEFEIPSDYKVTTKDELMKMFGGGSEE